MVVRAASGGRAVVLLLALTLLGGCAGEQAAPARGAPSEEPVAASLPTEWVAVFTVDDVDGLDDETQELMASAGEHIAIAPIGCWEGLSAALGDPEGDSLYAAAVVAASREELMDVVRQVGKPTLFEGELPAHCTD